MSATFSHLLNKAVLTGCINEQAYQMNDLVIIEHQGREYNEEMAVVINEGETQDRKF